jgi:hypothetical protein
MAMPDNTPEATSYVVTATFEGGIGRSDPERRTFVFNKNASLETIFSAIFPVEGSIRRALYRPPICVEISPDLTTVPPDKYAKAFAAEEEAGHIV